MFASLRLLLRGIRQVGLRPSWGAIAHTIRTRWIEARFADPQRPLRGLRLLRRFLARLPISPTTFPAAGPIAATLGQLKAHSAAGQTLTLTFAEGTLTLTVLAPDLIHARYRLARPGSGSPRRDPVLFDTAWPPCPFEVTETPQAIRLQTSRLACLVGRDDGQIRFLDLQGNPIAAQAGPVDWTANGQVVCRWTLPDDACFYGLGQRASGLDRRGRAYVNWNTDPRTYTDGDDPLNLCVPFLLALHSLGQQGFGMLIENTTRSRLDLGSAEPGVLSLQVADMELAYSFFYGPALSDVLRRYAEQTGRPALQPMWALGYHQCRWSYFPEERVRRLARDFRQIHQVPCDAIHLDIHHMDGYRSFTWDPDRFPDPAGLIADLHAQGIKLVTIVDPGIKIDRTYRVYQEGLEQDVFCRTPDGRLFVGPVWPGNCVFPDFDRAQVREWWGHLYHGLIEAGVDGVWNDINEPALFGEQGATIPGPVGHGDDAAPRDHRRFHNLYGLMTARATAEGLARLTPDRRPFVLTRSGWAGIQQYAAHWTGDNRATWESLRLTLPMVLGLGLSGIPFTGADVGGFEGFPSGELFTRWLQLGSFLPFFRAHTVFSSPDQEPWSWGEPYLSINRETIRRRYQLLPYLYTAHWQSTQSGLPIARPLFLAFQNDPATFAQEDAFLCGDALLVAPILEPDATRRSVYLPDGVWYDFWTGARTAGPAHVEADAPLERIPLYVRARSVLPLAPAREHVGRRRDDTLALHVYPGNGESWLYEDDGESTAYQGGACRISRFHLASSAARLTLERETTGTFAGYDRFEIVIHDTDAPARVEGMTGAEVTYDPAKRAVHLTGGPFDTLVLYR